MNYETVENDILSRLASIISIEKIVLPENQTDHKNANRITVAYKNSKYEDTVSTQFVGQEETANFKIIIQCRKLRGADGIYTYMASVRRWLLGYKPTDCTGKLQMVDSGFVDDVDGQWTYVLTMSTKGMAIEHPDDETFMTSKRIVLENSGIQEVVVESQTQE
jgi:hypothetical protein